MKTKTGSESVKKITSFFGFSKGITTGTGTGTGTGPPFSTYFASSQIFF